MRKLLLFLAFSLFIFSGCSRAKFDNTEVQPEPTVEMTEKQDNSVVQYRCQPDKTAFELLTENNHQVDFDESSFGKLITSIDGRAQSDGKYWLYSVDDKEATVGAEAYHCQSTEQIKWELK